ncbi:MAG: hypothetical protein GY898_10335 [Proteobacteria bacterium]|nr:hypothetical protein [Pseudomonadota bacterium]
MDVLIFAAFAAAVAIGATLAVERWGGLVGGILATLPTTIVPAAAGIHSSASPEAFTAAMGAIPGGMLLNALFLGLWREVPSRLPAWSLTARLGAMTALSLTAWLAAAVVLVMAQGAAMDRGAAPLALGAGMAGALLVLGVAACWKPREAPRGKRPVSAAAVASRGVLAAAAIGAAILIAQSGAGLAAGVASVFPAIFLTTMATLWIAQGEAVPGGAVGPMMLGSSSVAAYALIAAWSLPALGAAAGSVVAWTGAALGAALPAWWWLRRRTPITPAGSPT